MTPIPPSSPVVPGAIPPPVPPRKKRALWPFVLGGFVLLLGLGVLSIALAVGASHRVADSSVLVIKLTGTLPERVEGGDLKALFGTPEMTLRDVLGVLKKGAADKRIKGLVLKVEQPQLGWAKVEELRDAITAFKTSGKFAYAWGEDFSERGYAVALACDEVLMPADAPFELNGFVADVVHYPGMLEKVGIEVQYFRYGKYKSVSGETLGRKALTEPVKEMINDGLDGQFARYLKWVSDGRKLSVDEVKTIIDNPHRTSAWALEKKLVDGNVYWDEVEAKLKDKLGLKEKDKVEYLKASKYRGVSAKDAGLKVGDQVIALVSSVGLIVAGKGGVDPFSGDASQGADPIIEALRKAGKDDDVKAVVLRVDSPGGAGLGCDFVRREVEVLAKKKPVIVSMIDVAASGGYWVSMNGTAIVAEPSTITGSIGIWSVVPNLKGTYEKLGLNSEVFTRGAHADAINGTRPMTEEEAKVFDDDLHNSYRRFVSLAAKGRGLSEEDMEKVAQGRSWSGEKALGFKLVDRLGGLATAVELAKEKAKIPAEETVRLESYDEKKSLLQQLLSSDDDDDEGEADALVALMLKRAGFGSLARRLGSSPQVVRAVLEGERVFPLMEYDVTER